MSISHAAIASAMASNFFGLLLKRIARLLFAPSSLGGRVMNFFTRTVSARCFLSFALLATWSTAAVAQVDVWYTPASYAGPVAPQCINPASFGVDPNGVAITKMKQNNALTTMQCFQACRNPYTHLDTTITSPTTATARLRSNCTGSVYSYGITKVVNPKQPVCDSSETAANPCNLATGAKVQQVTDYRDTNGDLSLSRIYNSNSADVVPGVFGRNWQSNFDRRALGFSTQVPAADVQSMTAFFWRPGGQALSYRYNATIQQWEGDPDISDRVSQLVTAQGFHDGWVFVSGGGLTREIYDAWGRLIRLEDARGPYVWLAYGTNGLLSKVFDRSGRALVFTTGAKNVSAVALPHGQQITFAYASDVLTEVTYPDATPGVTTDNPKIRYLYEKPGKAHLLTGIVDERGIRSASWDYDAQGRVNLSVHGDSASQVDRVTVTYGSDGTATLSQPLGKQSTLSFTEIHGVRRLSGSSGACPSCNGEELLQKSFDGNGYPNIKVDLAGSVTDYDYDANGRLVQQIDVANDATGKRRTLQTDWHSVLRVPTERRIYDADNALVGKRAWTYNARGQVLTSTSIDPVTANTRTMATTYCEQADITAGTCPLLGLVTSVNGPRTDVNDLTTYTYYPSDDATCATSPTTCPHRKGDLWLVQDALGNISETLKYDGAGRVLSMKDANGVVTDFEYHSRGWLTARKVRGTDNSSEADDQITRIDYYPTGLVQKTTLPDGSYTSYTYDAAHRLTDITDGEGNKINYTLDNAGNRTKEDTLGTTGTVLRTLSRVYNQLGQLQTHKDAYDHGTGYVYDANGNTDTVTDALSRVTDNDYDPLNRLTKTIQDVGGLNVTTQFKYDAQDNLTEVVDPKNLSTKYTYNGLGDLKRLESPDTGVTDYTYDSAGNRQTQTDARGVTATYGYDALNRLVSVSYPDSSLNVGYSYDTAATACVSGETFAAGRLSQITDGSGSTRYCYDRFGQMVRKMQTTAGQSLTVRYAYTQAGQLSGVTYPDGTVADYVRDGLGRTTQVGVTRPGESRQILLTSASYYPFGPASEWVFGNGRLFQRTLNQNYQPGVIQDQSTGGLSLGYEFDAVGNLVKLRNGNQSEPPLRRYAYDALNRLTETRDGTTDALLQGYGYDATGNRTSATDGSVNTAYTLTANSHRLTDVGGVARTYDSVGNTTAIGGGAREFVYSDANRMSAVKSGGVTAMSYAYNGKGEQVRRTNGSDATAIVYDEAGHWLGEYDNAGTSQQQVVWLDDLPVGLIVGAAAASQPLHYIEADALGSPRVVVDAQRDVVAWAWPLAGEVFGDDAPTEDFDGDGTSLTFNLRFPGQRYDAASGLNYNYFRDYDVGSGRYVESDPIGLDGGISSFGYVGANPLVRSDDFGLDWYNQDQIDQMNKPKECEVCQDYFVTVTFRTRKQADRENEGMGYLGMIACSVTGVVAGRFGGSRVGGAASTGCGIAWQHYAPSVHPGDVVRIHYRVCPNGGRTDEGTDVQVISVKKSNSYGF